MVLFSYSNSEEVLIRCPVVVNENLLGCTPGIKCMVLDSTLSQGKIDKLS